MNAIERRQLSKEAQMQMQALKKIGRWRTIAIGISTLGAAGIYAAAAGESGNIFLGILGVVLMLAGFLSAVLLNLGIKNGKRNVEKMLSLLDEAS